MIGGVVVRGLEGGEQAPVRKVESKWKRCHAPLSVATATWPILTVWGTSTRRVPRCRYAVTSHTYGGESPCEVGMRVALKLKREHFIARFTLSLT